MWDQLSDLRNKFRTKGRPEKLGKLSEKKKLGEWTVITRCAIVVWCGTQNNVLYKIKQ